MLRALVVASCVAVSAASCLTVTEARAVPITFDLTLTPTVGTTSGTGSFSVDGPISPAFQSFNQGAGLLSMDFFIGGQHFSFATSPGNSNVTFINGSVSNITYSGTILNLPVNLFLSLAANGLQYQFGDIFNPANGSTGNITVSPHVSAVPGPIAGAGIPGLITVAGGLLAWLRRRKGPQTVAA